MSFYVLTGGAVVQNKQHLATSFEDRDRQPEALLNFTARVRWRQGDEAGVLARPSHRGPSHRGPSHRRASALPTKVGGSR